MTIDPNKALAKAQVAIARINARAQAAHDRRILNIARVTHRKPAEIEGVLAAGSLGLFGLVTAAVLFHVVPAENEKYAMLLLGALIGVVKDCFARYFSVTKAASMQRDTIATMAQAQVEQAKAVSAAAAAPPPTGPMKAEGDLTLTPTPAAP